MIDTPGAHGLFIDGTEQPAQAGLTFPVYAPATGDLVGFAAQGATADVDLAVASARRAFPAWSGLAPAQRELILLRAADAVESRRGELVDLLIDESGSTITKARYEVDYTAGLLRVAAGEARRLYGDTFPSERPERLSLVVREPLGVVLAIAPFNAPLVLLAKMIVFALAAGNSVIAKPSEETPLSALVLAALLTQAGLPPGVFNVVTGFGAECGEPLSRHPEVNAIAFTGSTATGIKIAEVAATGLRRVQLELGGKNPLLVLRDMDPERAAALAAPGIFAHAGQICMASARIIAEREVARSFAEALAREAERLYLGDLRDEHTAYGPLINQAALAKVTRHVETALAAGAELLTGGAIHSGLTYKPTVLWQPPPRSLVWCEETFGPVASVVAVDDLEQAIAVANDSPYGLSAGVLTNDLARGVSAARRIRCGAVHVGSHSFYSEALAPIGGLGNLSGIGRSGGKYSIEHFSELKWITLQGQALTG